MKRAAPMRIRRFIYSMINLSQIARHFSTDNDQKRSICPKLIAALAQAKSPPNHAPRKGIPGGCGNTPCPKSIATPVREVFCPELVIFPKTGVQIGNTGGIPSPLNIGEGRPQKEVVRSRTAPAIS